MQDTRPLLIASTDFPAIRRGGISTLQLNLGYLCNLSCVHCHVNAGPTRTEEMDAATADLVIEVLQARQIATLDLTGGAPELNAHFRRIVVAARKLGIEVIDRCNLTVLFEPGHESLADFLAEHGVNVTASLPCYEESNVNEQRGKGVYQQSIEALQLLNGLGYGKSDALPLNLVYNPVGAHLPPPQAALEADYKKQLGDRYGIVFNQLHTITNMPISRFGAVLLAQNQYKDYLELLKDNYSASNLDTVMCRNTVSVDWQGYLYDCDFNQMLELPIASGNGNNERRHIKELLQSDFGDLPIKVAEHCYGCTAGQGSSCGGALADAV
ncbi:MAG: arsenosugar biosynthesis radical SAM protein ArsS [Gammaproteobacteria bacterium]|nr:arsenosugar biosynthesis radical SAM protein ArsS [Gammaproteobacteria bacterium]